MTSKRRFTFSHGKGYALRSVTVRPMTVDDLRLIWAGRQGGEFSRADQLALRHDGIRYCIVELDDEPFNATTELARFLALPVRTTKLIQAAVDAMNPPEHMAQVSAQFLDELERKKLP